MRDVNMGQDGDLRERGEGGQGGDVGSELFCIG